MCSQVGELLLNTGQISYFCFKFYLHIKKLKFLKKICYTEKEMWLKIDTYEWLITRRPRFSSP